VTDDIVTRLREEAKRIRVDAVDVPIAFENCADEIERLRADVINWAKNADYWRDIFNAYTQLYDLPHTSAVVYAESEFRLLAETLDWKAVRGD